MDSTSTGQNNNKQYNNNYYNSSCIVINDQGKGPSNTAM